MKDSSNTIKGTSLILISALMYGLYGLFAKYLEHYDILFQTYVRCLFVGGILAVYGLYTHKLKRIQRADWYWFCVIFAFTSFSIAPIMYSFRFLTLGTSSFIFYASLTIFSYVFGFLFFKEKMSIVKIASLFFAIIGMFLVFSLNITYQLLFPALMAVLNGLASSGEVVFSKKISEKYSSVQITMLVFFIIAASHFLLSLYLGERQDLALVTTSLPTLLMFVFAAIIGMVAVVEGYKYVEPSIGSLIGLMEIVFSAVIGIIVFHESMTFTSALGGVCIIFAAGIPSLSKILREKYAKRTSMNS